MAGYADQHLHRLVVNVPVVAASWFEGDVYQPVLAAEGSQIAVTDEILSVGRVQFTLRPYAEILFSFIFSCALMCAAARCRATMVSSFARAAAQPSV